MQNGSKSSIHLLRILTRSNVEKKIAFWDKLGPGLITGASDDDPSGIATYSQAGAAYGLLMLWTAFLTYPLMYGIQEMCARIGIVSGGGLSRVIVLKYPKLLVWLMLAALFPAITFNIAADLNGMGAVSHLLFPYFPEFFYSTIFTIAIILGLVFFTYERMAAVLKWLCMSLFVYAVVPFLVNNDWSAVFSAVLVPKFEWSQKYWALLVAILGTTISPYLFFWQSSMSQEDHNHKNNNSNLNALKEMKLDVNVGMFLSNLIMFFIILTTASVLFPAGLTNIETLQDAAKALEPLAGKFAFTLFSLGVIGTGLLAIPVLGGCLGYIFADIFDWEQGMDKKFHEAKLFYSVIISSIILALFMNLFNMDPIQSLIITAIIYGLLAPFLIAIILHICNQSDIMQGHTNNWISNLLGIFAFILMGGSALFLVYFYLSS